MRPILSVQRFDFSDYVVSFYLSSTISYKCTYVPSLPPSLSFSISFSFGMFGFHQIWLLLVNLDGHESKG